MKCYAVQIGSYFQTLKNVWTIETEICELEVVPKRPSLNTNLRCVTSKKSEDLSDKGWGKILDSRET
jgi:hypothetical protein